MFLGIALVVGQPGPTLIILDVMIVPIDLRVAFKPTATINFAQDTVTREGESTELRAKGRHDPCVLPRAVPMVEAMINLVLLDHWLRNRNKKLADLVG